jgi:hypothetical protein
MSEEFDYLEKPVNKEAEEVWCKIGSDGELEIFNWEFVEKVATEYDAAGVGPKTNPQIICKLAVLIRKQTLDQASKALLEYRHHPATTSIIVLKDPLGDKDEIQD